MAIVKKHSTPQGSDEWLRIRENKVTGSIAYVLLKDGLKIALSKNSERFAGNWYTRRGHTLESQALSIYSKLYDTKPETVGYVTNSDYPNALCSPDGLDDKYLLEVKCFGAKRHLSIRKSIDIPFEIVAQIQFNLMICGLKKARLILYNPDIEPRWAFLVIELGASKNIHDNFKRILSGVLQPR